ncbi:Ig-like domain-containing protein [Robertkochia flava]|uniref:Ig-like domain-containing protein n=1 Tax=Robertkochia flava TaxID=3447986 RepID=UPI001CCE6D2F|nr:gliding motility-associated C-terminal domain-containing protein [Robertkochia marina]
MKKQPLLVCILFFYTLMGQAQNLQQPEPGFTHACISNSFNAFEVAFSFTGGAFNSDNAFIIELSDSTGDFSEITVLKTVTDKNNAYEFKTALEFPQSLSGKGYRLRIRATSPAMVSEPTAAFEAFYVPDTQLILNNYEASSLCAAEPTLLELNEDIADSYIWYKDGEVFTQTDVPYLNIEQAGQYYAEPDLGACSGSLISNIVTVDALDPITVSLGVPREIVSCTNEDITLKAASDDPSLTYQWFRNDSPVASPVNGNSSYSFSTGETTFGNYYLKATNVNGCSAVTATVVVSEKDPLQISQLTPDHAVILGNTSMDLGLEANKSGLEVVWYRDGNEVDRGTDRLHLTVSGEGVYVAEITDPAGCGTSMVSSEFYVYEPVSFTAVIGLDEEYSPCDNSNANISLESLYGLLSNGDQFPVDSSLYHNFEFNWIRDGELLLSGPSQIALNDHTYTGEYVLEVVYAGETFWSAAQEVHIGLPEITLVQENALTCLEAAVLKVPVMEEVIYTWYRDDIIMYSGLEASYEADLPGVYRVEAEYMGCLVSSGKKDVVAEQDALVNVFPGDRVALIPDQEVALVASGAEAYTWSNGSGEILSQSETLNVSDEGIYYLTAVTGGCETKKEVEVYFNLTTAIPNVVTPNSDQVNDRWVLPQKLLDDPELQVIICDSYGNPVLKTNNYDNSWPSSVEQLSSGDPNYFYILNKGGRNIQKGMITLVR